MSRVIEQNDDSRETSTVSGKQGRKTGEPAIACMWSLMDCISGRYSKNTPTSVSAIPIRLAPAMIPAQMGSWF